MEESIHWGPEAWDASDWLIEQAAIEAESIGWIPLEPGVYLHKGSDDMVIEIVGQATAAMAGMNVIWVV